MITVLLPSKVKTPKRAIQQRVRGFLQAHENKLGKVDSTVITIDRDHEMTYAYIRGYAAFHKACVELTLFLHAEFIKDKRKKS